MPRAKPPKNLVVDGTAKLAAKSKPNDKHEAPDLNIEEATVASPRPSRKRAGDYFDFDDGEDVKIASKLAESKANKPTKKKKTVSAGKDEATNAIEAKPASTARRGKKGKDLKAQATESPSEISTKAVGEEKRPTKPKVAKDNVAMEKPQNSKKPEKATTKLAADKEHKTDATPKTAKTETKTKAKKSKGEEGAAEKDSPTVAPDVAVEEGPSETLLGLEKEQTPGVTEKQSATDRPATKAAKSAKKLAKDSTVSNTQSVKNSAASAARGGADVAKNGAGAGAQKVKKAAKLMAPATGTAADVADSMRKGIKAGTEEVKQVAKSMASSTQTPAGAADVVKEGAKAGGEKTKRGAKSKDPKPAKDDESIKLRKTSEEQSKPEASKSKKRKAPARGDTEMVKTDILDPLSEHASAKKKQKKANTKSKSLGDAVGDLLATATEGANAARASLGGLATSIVGGASEAAERATDGKEPFLASAMEAKGKAKAIAEDVAGSSSKTAATDAPGNADSDDEPDDHTIALLAGFESDGDEGNVSSSGFEQGQAIPRLPQQDTIAKKLEGVQHGASEGPGVVYVGRIPHGFYEHEMREYFSQFGDISRLRLSRSLKSGASRHYAFIEFTSADVAKIVADTMDNYLMFGHILKCKMVAKEQVHENLWKGANKRFKAVPWNKIEGRKFEMGLGREQWAGRIEGEKKRRAAKNEKTKEIGYEFEAGELKGVGEVPVRDAVKEIENEENVEVEKSLVTAGGEDGNGPVVVSEEVKTKRVKKVKGKTEETTTATTKKTKRALDAAGEETVGPAAKKARKVKNAPV